MDAEVLRCPDCGNEEHPATAIVCVKCGAFVRPHLWRASGGPVFPCVLNVRTWLEGEPRRVFGPYRRCFALAFTLMDAPRQPVTADGNLHIAIAGVGNRTSVRTDVRVHRSEFAVRRFRHGTVSFAAPSFLYLHPKPVVAVPTDRGCELHLRFEADGGKLYEWSQVTYFFDNPPVAETAGSP